jgi:hypothetical protein
MPWREEHRKAVCVSSARTVVRPVKAGVFSRRQTCRGKSQKPRSLDSRVAGNQDPEAYRQDFPWGSANHWAVTKVNAEVASKMRKTEGRACNRRAKAAWIVEIWPIRLFHFGGVIATAR